MSLRKLREWLRAVTAPGPVEPPYTAIFPVREGMPAWYAYRTTLAGGMQRLGVIRAHEAGGYEWIPAPQFSDVIRRKAADDPSRLYDSPEEAAQGLGWAVWEAGR